MKSKKKKKILYQDLYDCNVRAISRHVRECRFPGYYQVSVRIKKKKKSKGCSAARTLKQMKKENIGSRKKK